MTTIETVVAALPYDRSEWSGKDCTSEQIDEIEAKYGAKLPEDVDWYLRNTGDRSMGSERFFRFQRSDYLHQLNFDKANGHWSMMSGADDVAELGTTLGLAGDVARYLPFADTKSATDDRFFFLINLNQDDFGAVWILPRLRRLDENPERADKPESRPIRLASSLTEFLTQLEDARGIWLRQEISDHNKANLKRYWDSYVPDPEKGPTRADTPQQLVEALIDDPTAFQLDAAAEVISRAERGTLTIESQASFDEKVETFYNLRRNYPLHQIKSVAGPEFKFEGFDEEEAPTYLTNAHPGFKAVVVSSNLENGLNIREVFLCVQSSDDDSWTLADQINCKVDALKIKGVGTFQYEDRVGWMLAKKKRPVWSPIPLEFNLYITPDAFTSDLHEPLRACVQEKAFEPVLSAFIFDYFQKEVLPEIEADDPHTHLGPIPKITDPADIGKLFGKHNNTLNFLGAGDFDLQLDAKWEEEHGLSLKVRDWKILKE